MPTPLGVCHRALHGVRGLSCWPVKLSIIGVCIGRVPLVPGCAVFGAASTLWTVSYLGFLSSQWERDCRNWLRGLECPWCSVKGNTQVVSGSLCFSRQPPGGDPQLSEQHCTPGSGGGQRCRKRAQRVFSQAVGRQKPSHLPAIANRSFPISVLLSGLSAPPPPAPRYFSQGRNCPSLRNPVPGFFSL